jgi:hypothetical protein
MMNTVTYQRSTVWWSLSLGNSCLNICINPWLTPFKSNECHFLLPHLNQHPCHSLPLVWLAFFRTVLKL